MKNSNIIAMFVLLFLFYGCGESDSCKNLSWEASSVADSSQISLKASAGSKCENYNDYYEGDLNQIITKIQSMKFIINKECYAESDGINDPQLVDCPDFVPETMEFGELVKCEFETPPDENTHCAFYGPELYFKGAEGGVVIRWGLLGDNNPQIQYAEKGGSSFSYEKDDITVEGSFENETLTTATIVFTWTEDEVEKTLEFSAKVEIKE
ncbi:MAG TPA: hypothetical protein PKG52_04575 [bacterium]|mgnify:CR=1 FL=1|nr:hypothetical protein [bacterium]